MTMISIVTVALHILLVSKDCAHEALENMLMVPSLE